MLTGVFNFNFHNIIRSLKNDKKRTSCQRLYNPSRLMLHIQKSKKSQKKKRDATYGAMISSYEGIQRQKRVNLRRDELYTVKRTKEFVLESFSFNWQITLLVAFYALYDLFQVFYLTTIWYNFTRNQFLEKPLATTVAFGWPCLALCGWLVWHLRWPPAEIIFCQKFEKFASWDPTSGRALNWKTRPQC